MRTPLTTAHSHSLRFLLGLAVFALLFYWRKKLARQATGLDKPSSNNNGNSGNGNKNNSGGSGLSEQARMMRAMAEQQRYASGVRMKPAYPLRVIQTFLQICTFAFSIISARQVVVVLEFPSSNRHLHNCALIHCPRMFSHTRSKCLAKSPPTNASG